MGLAYKQIERLTDFLEHDHMEGLGLPHFVGNVALGGAFPCCAPQQSQGLIMALKGWLTVWHGVTMILKSGLTVCGGFSE